MLDCNVCFIDDFYSGSRRIPTNVIAKIEYDMNIIIWYYIRCVVYPKYTGGGGGGGGGSVVICFDVDVFFIPITIVWPVYHRGSPLALCQCFVKQTWVMGKRGKRQIKTEQGVTFLNSIIGYR